MVTVTLVGVGEEEHSLIAVGLRARRVCGAAKRWFVRCFVTVVVFLEYCTTIVLTAVFYGNHGWWC